MATKKTKLELAKAIASKVKKPKRSSVARYTAQGQGHPQSKSWTEPTDESISAKPVGWRWTNAGASKLNKGVQSKPSRADIEQYKGKTFRYKGETVRYLYQEKRVDKSDLKKSAKFKEGGETKQKQGQYSRENGTKANRSADKVHQAKPVGWRFRGNKYRKPSEAHIKQQLKLSPDERDIYNEKRRDKSDYDFDRRLEDGGTLGAGSFRDGGMFDVRQKGSQSGNPTRSMDKVHQAKPVGWRFRGNKYRKPSESHIRQQLKLSPSDRDIYYEVRKDKSDYDFDRRLEDGGTLGAGSFKRGGYTPQYVRNEDIESITLKSGKVIKNNSIYDGAYVSKSLKLASGGEANGDWVSAYGRGGVERVANSQARDYSENLIPFKGANLEGKVLDNGDYVVLSYGYYPIWWFSKSEGKWYGNSTKYSVTTSKQMTQSRPTYDATMLSKNDLTDKMMKHHAKFENGGALDGILGDTDAPTTSVGGTQFSTADLTSHLDLNNPNF